MKIKILPKVFFFFLVTILFSSCKKDSNPVETIISYSFEMYYLQNDTLSFSDIENVPIENIKLQGNPFLSHLDIKSYTILYIDNNPDQSYHIIIKDSSKGTFANKIQPYVIVLNGAIYCIGEYWPGFMSVVPRGALLYRESKNDFHLDPIDDVAKERLKDPRIIETLGKYGVQVEYRDIG